jgi:hypothetical protein
MTAPTDPRPVDVHALPAMLTTLRLPSFQRHWAALAQRADTEGWHAARFLAALAELELAERDARRIQRHLHQSRLPGGKTLATLDFKALPGVPRARVEALAAGDWVETGANLIAIGNSGAGKTHVLCGVGHALVEAGKRVLYSSTTDIVQKLQAARRDLALEAALAKLDKFDLVRSGARTRGAHAPHSSTTSPTRRRIRPRVPCSSSSSHGDTRPGASPSLQTSPSAPGDGSSRTRPSPSPPSPFAGPAVHWTAVFAGSPSIMRPSSR